MDHKNLVLNMESLAYKEELASSQAVALKSIFTLT